jgi:spermidine/putrescine-binding protein
MAALACAVAVGCGADESDGPATAGGSAGIAPDLAACEGATLNFIGLAGEEGEAELADFRDEHGMKLQVTNNPDWGQVIGAMRVGQPYDLNTIPVLEAQRMIRAGVVQPIDTSKLEHWESLAPALRDSEDLRGPDGKVYGVPILWGDGPYVYAPDRVDTPPKSIAELLEPEWKGRYSLFDDPGLPFFMLAQTLGFDESPDLTTEQFEQVKAKAKALVDNAAAFSTSYQDATDRLVAGDVDLVINGWEAMVGFGAKKDKELAYEFFDESQGGGYWDGLAIPKTAEHPECALAYIDALIAPDANAKLADNLTSGAANLESEALVGKAAKAYDYDLVKAPQAGLDFVRIYPPEEPKEGYASLKDWQDAWAAIKAG